MVGTTKRLCRENDCDERDAKGGNEFAQRLIALELPLLRN